MTWKAFNMQRELASEQELNFKKRARRRLVGAIALVLLMIIVLPIILKDRNSSNTQEKITITLPSEHALPEPSDFDSSVAPDETLVPLPKAENVMKDVAVAPQSSPTISAPESSDVKADAIVSNKVDDKIATGKNAPQEVNNSKDTEKAKFYVQVGVFSDAGNVKQLQTKLTDLGYKSHTEKINTDKGQKIRLRTQVFGDRNDAAIALQNIKDAGLTGMVVSQ
jgi:DedD protein